MTNESTPTDTPPRMSRWRMAAWGFGVFLLLLPLVAMQITEEVVWTASDFVFAAVLIFGGLGVYEVATLQTRVAAGAPRTWYRAGVGLGIAATFLLFWSNGAVSITDSPADIFYVWVGVLGIAAVVLALTRPRAGAFAMVVVALALVVSSVATLLMEAVPNPYVPVLELVGITGFFVALYGGAAWLLREAAAAGQAVA